MIYNKMLKSVIRDSSLPASEILVLLYIYSRMGEKEYLETKYIEISEHIPYLSQTTVYDAINHLADKGYIRVDHVRKSWDKKIYRCDSGETNQGYMKLTYKLFQKIVKYKDVCSSGSALRALLHFFLKFNSSDKVGLNFRNISMDLSNKLRVSKRTIQRIMNILSDSKLIQFRKNKNRRNQVSYSIWFSKDLLEERNRSNMYHRSEFLVDQILRNHKINASTKDKKDTAGLFIQYRNIFASLGLDAEEELCHIIQMLLEATGSLNPRVVNRNISSFLRNPRRNILVTA